jgi:Zn-dependent protease with chaperone function
MTDIRGYWYDGLRSAQVAAICSLLEGGAVQVRRMADGQMLKQLPHFSFRVSPRLAGTPRILRLASGEAFETDDNDALDAILAGRLAHSPLHWVHRFESRWGWVAFGLALLLLLGWGAARFGIPAAAKLIAFKLPPGVLARAESELLATLDRAVFSPSQIAQQARERLLHHFKPAMETHGDLDLRIAFRKGGHLGANAFALPSGTIVLTDEMIALAETDDELLAVLFHEIGHVVHRHGMRNAIQDSLLSFALLAITGDVAGSTELVLGLPVLLTQLSYSRQFEREADRYALACLRTQRIPPQSFARLMRRVEQKHREKNAPPRAAGEKSLENYFSTHPLTEERLRPFEDSVQ